MCRFRILVEYEDSPLAPVGKYLRLYDREYHRHDQVREEPVLFDPGEFEYDELLGQEVLFGILRYILVSFSRQELPAVQKKRRELKILLRNVFPFQDIRIILFYMVIESHEIVFLSRLFVIVLDEQVQCRFPLRFLSCEHVFPITLHDSRDRFQVRIVRPASLQVERIDTQRCLSVIIHVKRLFGIKFAELAETFSELHHYNRIVLFKKLVSEILGESGFSPAGTGDDHPVACIRPSLSGIPYILFDRDTV